MHNTTDFCSHKSACRLLDYIQGDGELHRSIPAHARFKRFAFDQFHRVETLAILFAVIDHPSNIWVTNIRSRTRFAQKTRSRARVLRDLAIDDLESNKRVQNCIARAISYGHRSRTELNRKTVCSRLYFEVRVWQRSGYQSAARRWPFRLLSVARERKANEAPQTFAVRTTLSERSAAGRAGLRSFTLRFRGSEAHADVVHIGKATSGHQYLVQMAQFSIDICRIGDRTAHFCSQRFTKSLAETRKPGTQSRDWHSEPGCGFLLTGRLGAAASHERP